MKYNRTAKEIYSNMHGTGNAENAGELERYFSDLSHAIIAECLEKGECELVDELYESSEHSDPISFMAFCYASYRLAGLECSEHGFFVSHHADTAMVAFNEKTVLGALRYNGRNAFHIRSILSETKETSFEDKNAKESVGNSGSTEEQMYRYPKKDMEAFRKESERDLIKTMLKNRIDLSSVEKRHDEMCEKSNELLRAFIPRLSAATDTINSSLNEIIKAKDELFDFNQNWQKALYPELKPFGERFADLYRLVNIDRRYIEKTLKDINENQVPDVSSLLEKMQKSNESLSRNLRRFEVSLNCLGMYTFYPSEGEAFDESCHETDCDLLRAETDRISGCLVPGVKYRNSNNEDDVIIKARVTIG